MFALLSLLCAAIVAVTAAPVAELDKRSVTPLSTTQLASFAPFTQFARAAYCPTDVLKNWSCGGACNALPGFQPTLVGGNGNSVQIFFVGYWPTQNTVVVAHEGTDPTKFLSLLTDADVFMGPLSTSLFPGVSSSVQVHDGFRDAQAETAPQILTEVKRLMTLHNTQSVTCVGHSLGGAIAEIDSLFFTLNLPSSTTIRAFTYGTPRVGNPAFAQLIDQKVPNFKHINNERDVIPIVPGRFLGFAHPAGEIHIVSPGNAVSCPGDDDATDAQCTIQTVPNIFDSNILDHLGPYEGISIGTIFCN